MWIIFKVSIEFVIILYLLYVLIIWPRSTWDLSSPRPGVKPSPPALEGKVLTTGGNFLRVTFLKTHAAATAAKSLQSCPTLCDPIDGSPPGSPVPGILQARILEWVAISSSNAWKWKVKVKSLSRVRLFVTPWTAAHQAPLSMGLSRQEYWSGVSLPSPLKTHKNTLFFYIYIIFFFWPHCMVCGILVF